MLPISHNDYLSVGLPLNSKGIIKDAFLVKKKSSVLQFFSIRQIYENYNYSIKFCHSSPILTLLEKLYPRNS